MDLAPTLLSQRSDGAARGHTNVASSSALVVTLVLAACAGVPGSDSSKQSRGPVDSSQFGQLAGNWDVQGKECGWCSSFTGTITASDVTVHGVLTQAGVNYVLDGTYSSDSKTISGNMSSTLAGQTVEQGTFVATLTQSTNTPHGVLGGNWNVVVQSNGETDYLLVIGTDTLSLSRGRSGTRSAYNLSATIAPDRITATDNYGGEGTATLAQ